MAQLQTIPDPDVPIIDPKTGFCDKNWYKFFFNTTNNVANTTRGRDLRIGAQTAFGKICFLEDYGLVPDYLINGSVNAGYTDNVAAWNAVMANATRGDQFILPVLDNGQSYLAFNDTIALPNETQLVGRGRSTSVMVRAFNPTGGTTTMFLDIGLHTTVQDMLIMCGLGTFGGIAIGKVATNADDAAQDNVIRNVFIGGIGPLTSCNFTAGLVIDSQLGATHFGSRSVLCDGMEISRYTGWGVKLVGHNGAHFVNIDLAANNGGVTTPLDLYWTGTTDQPTNSCLFSGGSIDQFLLEYVTSSNITTGAIGNDCTIDDSCSSVIMTTGFFGTGLTVGGSNNCVYAGKYQFASTL